MKKLLQNGAACFCFIILIACLSCVYYTSSTNGKPPELIKDKKLTLPVRTDWEQYGAYYEIDELFIEIPYEQVFDPFFTGASSTSVLSRIFISKRIRILNKEGTNYGTVSVPASSGEIKVFDLHLFDENGVEKPLNLVSLQQEYEKTETIIFPKVTPGCVLEIFIEFSSLRPVLFYERWFSRDIPVYKAKFTLSHPHKLDYGFKEYGRIGAQQVVVAPDNNDFTYHIWTRENILPRSRVGFQGLPDKTEPRVALALKYGFDKPVFSAWYDITHNLLEEYFEEDYTILDENIQTIIDTIVKGETNPYKKADRVLAWIQDNMSLMENNEYHEFNPDDILKERKASVWELAYLCKKMFNKIDITSDIIFTRSHSLGGFDETFVNPLSIQIPVVTATIGTTKYCAYPYVRGGVLGEYPQDYFGLKGLALYDQKVVTLPSSIAEESQSEYNYSLDFKNDTLFHSLDVTFSGYMSYNIRRSLLSLQSKEVKELFQKMISSFSESNKLDKCLVLNLKDRGKPLKVKMTFFNQNCIIERKGAKQIGLSHIFDDYFSSVDSARISPLNFDTKTTIRETVLINKPEGKVVILNMACEPVKNNLFSVLCSSSENPGSLKMSRTIVINKCDIPQDQISSLSENVKKLNQIKESYIVIQ